MLTETIVVALIVAYLQGGRLRNLNQLSFKWMGLALLAFAIQFLLDWNNSSLLSAVLYKQVLHTLSYALLFGFLLRNLSLPGLKCIVLGVFLNFLVIFFNGGAMPVDPTMLPEQHRQLLALNRDGTHSLLTAKTHLTLLADRIYVYLPVIKGQVFSIGDIIIDVGSFNLIYTTMKRVKGHWGGRNSWVS